tara:strand:+ start:321 stop:779 length:459 start_codon:yes stop_codon:yes gene_type:complete
MENITKILKDWDKVLAKAKDRNPALHFILGTATPISVDESTITLLFKWRMQQEQLLKLEYRDLIESILEKVYGIKYRIEAIRTEEKTFNFSGIVDNHPLRIIIFKNAINLLISGFVSNPANDIGIVTDVLRKVASDYEEEMEDLEKENNLKL